MTTYTRFPLSKARFMTWLMSLPENEPVRNHSTNTLCECPLETALSVIVEPVSWSVCNGGCKRLSTDDKRLKLPKWAKAFIKRVDTASTWTWVTVTAAECISILKKSR